MKDSFFSFDDEPSPVVRDLSKPRKYIIDPRDIGGVLVGSKSVDKAKCSICDQKLALDIFYFDGKTRKFIRCEGCKKYLFELEKKPKVID
nr:hypothetical protein [Candidatus Sigynarchaeota archaeon]